jgi:hypothetical protein
VQLARRAGAFTAVPMALINRAGAHIHAGEFALADGSPNIRAT